MSLEDDLRTVRRYQMAALVSSVLTAILMGAALVAIWR